jgi:hypothetical protein
MAAISSLICSYGLGEAVGHDYEKIPAAAPDAATWQRKARRRLSRAGWQANVERAARGRSGEENMPMLGVYRGTLIDVTNLSIGKVAVNVPALGLTNIIGPVVYSCNAPWMMQVGSAVIVAFEGGDVARPVILGVVD